MILLCRFLYQIGRRPGSNRLILIFFRNATEVIIFSTGLLTPAPSHTPFLLFKRKRMKQLFTSQTILWLAGSLFSVVVILLCAVYLQFLSGIYEQASNYITSNLRSTEVQLISTH
jgi:hypothetical protein